MAYYSFFIVLGSGSFVFGMYVLACLARIPHLLCVVICPMTAMRMKKRLNKVPIGFKHYDNEFDFNCETEDPPCSFDVKLAA